MNIFMLIAGIVVLGHLAVALQRPRIALLVSGVLWLLYAVYEHYIATGVLCDKDCNIRVDLVFFIPILALATYWAYQSCNDRPGPARIAATTLGSIGLFVLAFFAESRGYGLLSGVVLLGIPALIFLAVKTRPKPTSA